MSLYTFFENNVYKKLYMIEFCNDHNLPNLVGEKTCCKIPQNQICVDLSRVKDGKKVFKNRSGLSLSHKLITIREV